jgi:hypothetical protein
VYAFKTPNTHNKDPAVSVRKSQDCRKIKKPEHAPKFFKTGKRVFYDDAPMSALTSLISGCDTF